MEPETISKNGASLKSQMSKGNIIKKVFLLFVALIGFGVGAVVPYNLKLISSVDAILNTEKSKANIEMQQQCSNGKCPSCSRCYTWCNTANPYSSTEKCRVCGGDGKEDEVTKDGKIIKNAKTCTWSGCDKKGNIIKYRGGYNCPNCHCKN